LRATLRLLGFAVAIALIGGCGSSRRVADAATLSAQRPAPDSPYVQRLIGRARALELGTRTGWLRLGHYRTGLFAAGFESEVDGPNFFLSPRGKIDPQAELEATLRALFVPLARLAAKQEHASCRFPARLMFLQQALAIDPRELPPARCEKFITFVAEANPRSASLIFSSYYLNNPASAFGHTFLRLEKASMAVGQKRELLDYAIDFSADVDTGNALVYAFRGLLGGFPGTVKRMPHYYKVREYNDLESRDMWEYRLELSGRELYMLVAHIWEVGHTYFDYYYLDENCSFRILALLEAAKPSLRLTEDLSSPVLPADTVRALFANPELVSGLTYRPSARTQFEHDVEGLDGEQKDLVEALADDANAVLPARMPLAAQVQVLDAAADLVDVHSIEALVHHADPLVAEHKRRLLERRATLGVASPRPPVTPPWHKDPRHGHASKRVGIAGGFRDPDRGFLTIDFRLAMHDLADPSDGYPDLAEIEFLPTRLRVYPRARDLHFALDDFSVVEVVSLNALRRFDLAPSWRVAIGARTLEREGCEGCLAGKLRLGGGLALSGWDDALVLFMTVDGWVYAGPELSGIAEQVVRAGFGPAPGVRIRLDSDLVWLLSGELGWFPTQADEITWQADSVLRWSFAHDQALSLELRARRYSRDAQLFALIYF
jgi:hypothetical protein